LIRRVRVAYMGGSWVGDDDLMAKPFETAGHPLTVGGGFDQDARPGALAQDRREALGLGADALLDQFASLGEDADLAFPLVDVNANMVHGWPPPFCGVDRV